MPGDAAFRHEQRRVAAGMAAAIAVTAAALSAAAWWGSPAALPVAERLQAALRTDLLVVVWLAAAIGRVAMLRFRSPADIAGSSVGTPSQHLRDAVAVLQNTAEQVLLAVLAHLALAASLARPTTLLATLAALFCAGRLLFWIGYRSGAGGRALGFALTFYPSVAALVIAAASVLLGRAG